MIQMQIVGARLLERRMTQLQNGGSNLCAQVNLQVALPMFRQLKMTAPVFRGYLQRDMNMQVSNQINKSTTYIRFPTHDPERGHGYAHFAEHGRFGIYGKTNPKMRFWRTPAGNVTTNHDMVVTSNVRNAEPSFFIRNTMVAHKPLAGRIAALEVNKWLRR